MLQVEGQEYAADDDVAQAPAGAGRGSHRLGAVLAAPVASLRSARYFGRAASAAALCMHAPHASFKLPPTKSSRGSVAMWCRSHGNMGRAPAPRWPKTTTDATPPWCGAAPLRHGLKTCLEPKHIGSEPLWASRGLGRRVPPRLALKPSSRASARASRSPPPAGGCNGPGHGWTT